MSSSFTSTLSVKKNKYYQQNKSKKSQKKKIYRKKRKTFRLRGGTYLQNNLKTKFQVSHPLQPFVKNSLEDNYLIHLDRNNLDQINYNDIFTQAFFQKYVDILNDSFEREREHSIAKGYYGKDFKHDINSVKGNIHSPSFQTYILTSNNLTPISFLYVEERNQDNDYDKVWTVCTDKEYRGKGMSSKLMNEMTVNQLNNNRNRMLLEVYNDDVIHRNNNDVRQKQIMAHFGKNGFVHTPLEDLSHESHSGLIHPLGNTKLMVFNPTSWYENNNIQVRNLNSKARRLCENNN